LSGDPYLIPGTDTLANRVGITDADQLARFETRMSIVRLAQLEAGEVAVAGRWDLAHLQAFHRHIFQDVYHWAGQLRTVDISKGGDLFCRPQYIESAAADIFSELARADHLQGLERSEFVAGAARLLSGVNSLHPHREGNGRAQRAFLGALAAQAGWDINWSCLDPARNVAVSIASFRGDDSPMIAMLDQLVTARPGGIGPRSSTPPPPPGVDPHSALTPGVHERHVLHLQLYPPPGTPRPIEGPRPPQP